MQSLPLHHSQKEVLKNKEEWRFEYYLLPTHDFMMEILSFGSSVKVLEPLSFQKNVLKKLQTAIARY